MIKVSIIIPVYNVEQYLNKCLESCVKQSLQEIEVIVINDASPDCSGEIMHKFGELYPDKIRNVFLETNIRQGGARNVGIMMARGKYLCFVDSDDYIDEMMCEKLYKRCERNNLDIVCCDGYYVYGDKKVYHERMKKYDMDGHLSLHHFTGQQFMLIRREIVIKNNLFYPEKILHEDTAVVPLWYLCAQRMEIIEEPMYFQNVHVGSVTSSIDFFSALQMIQVLKILLDNAKKIGIYSAYKREIDAFIFWRIFCATRHLLRLSRDISIEKIILCEAEIAFWRKYDFVTELVDNLLTLEEKKIVMCFINNTEQFWKLDWKECQKKIDDYAFDGKREKIQKLVDKVGSSNEIVIWGAGQKGKKLLTTLKRMNVKYVVGDNNSDLKDRSLQTEDIVRDLKWVADNVSNAVFIITATRSYQDIVRKIETLIPNPVTVDFIAYLEYDLGTDEVIE